MDVLTSDEIIEEAHQRAYQALPKQGAYKDLSTVIVTPVRGDQTIEKACDCCGEPVKVSVPYGFHPLVVESWKRIIKPMNQPMVDLMAHGQEVGAAYQQVMEYVLAHEQLRDYRYVLFLEDDVVIPTMAHTRGPLWALYDRLAEGYDIANGLYWTRGELNMPLIFGDPAQGTSNFECLTTGWQPGDVVECNGAGMGFSLWKMEIFKNPSFEKPWFKTLEEAGVGAATQDLYAYRKVRELGYRVCVDTAVRCGHYDAASGQVF